MKNIGTDFSGVGAFEQALIRLEIDYKTIFACDIDKYARQTFIANYGEPDYFPHDVYDREIPEKPLDIYMTSPPCQAFSLAGNRQGEDDHRGVLFYNSHEFIQKNKPRYFIFENVKGLLSDDDGKTFQRWLDYLGGKSVNGNPLIFPHEESVPYHIYYQVLNSKNYGVPQNRERVFIIGIRDDADNTFSFPKPFHLEKRLKDVLDDDVAKKYYLSDKMLELISFNGKEKGIIADLNKGGQKGEVHSEDSNTISCLTATDYKQPKQVQIGTWRTHEDGRGFRPTADNTCPTIPARAREDGSGQAVIQIWNMKDDVIIHDIPEIVSVRKHKVDIKGLQKLLKDNKKTSVKKIAEAMEVPKTEAEHWFRTDKHFGIPNPDLWMKLKVFMNIETDQFDKQIMEFVEQEGVYEKSNRVYDSEGVAPTVTSTGADERVLIGAMRGRNPENPKSRKKGDNYEQTLEVNPDGVSNTLSTVQKDNVVILQKSHDYREDGSLREFEKYSPSLRANMGDNHPMVKVPNTELNFLGGTKPHNRGDGKKSRDYSKQDRVYDAEGIAETIPAQDWTMGNYKIDYKIRRLTPRECFRLMDFPDTFKIDQVSETQAYKQAGNSIVVAVLVELIKKLNL